MKTSAIFMCNSCGNEFPKWAGQCSVCKEWNTLVEVTSFLKKPKGRNVQSAMCNVKSMTPKEALSENLSSHFSTNIGEFDRVLGSGLTRGGVYLIAGQPGIGKSTLLTQLAISLSPHNVIPQPPVIPASPSVIPAKAGYSPLYGGIYTKMDPRLHGDDKDGGVLYVCSEENPSQVASRIQRLMTTNQNNVIPAKAGIYTKMDPRLHGDDSVHLLNTSSLENILSQMCNVQSKMYNLVIVDSIQSIATDLNATTAGSPSQIRDCANYLIRTAKETNIPMIIVGHVTKDGDIAGPKMLEHMVDVVLQLEGDRQHELRLLRGVKNRFGPTDETGIFKMTGDGLIEVKDPSQFLLEGRLTKTPGSVLGLIMEGSRPMTAEIQALVVDSAIPIPRRIAKGINANRLQLICAILTKHLKLPLGTKDVFVNVTGGLNINEPGVDLAIALAIISSVKNKALPENSICFGELGLLGEIRNVSFQDKRLKEAKALGYKHIYSPSTHPHLSSIISKK